MNRINRILTSLCVVTAITFLSSCIKDKFDAPAEKIPSAGLTANTTIADLRAIHLLPGDLDTITDDIIIQGVVVATDESGNYYKSFVIQDSTGGIDISIDQTDVYTFFRLGQKIFIKCKGLFLGDYGGNIQLGYKYGGGIGRIPAALVKEHLFADGMPGTPPAAKVVTLTNLSNTLLGTLIQLDSVYFPDAGQIFAPNTASATNHDINDVTNSSALAVRTSMYANFAGKIIPHGFGSVRGILSIYNGVYQLLMRDTNDLIGFGGKHPFIIKENFTNGLGTFTEYSVTGAQIWAASSFGSDKFAKMSGYSNPSYYANEDWLISPPMNLDLSSNETLNFFSMMKYGTSGDGSLKVMYSNNYTSGDPNNAIWTEITSSCTLSTGNFTKTSSGDVSLAAVTGTNVRIAFKYTCTTSNVATWEIGGIIVKEPL